jgi:hypothetical protein
MRLSACLAGLGFLLVGAAANAQGTATTVNPESHPATTAGSGSAHSAVTPPMMEHTHARSATTVTKAGRDQPIGADGSKPVSR